MRYWRTGILCGLLACLGCGTFTHTRTERPSFISPPVGRPIAPDVPALNPDSTIQPTLPQDGGPRLNPSTTRRPSTTRISTYQLDSESAKYNPPPKSGYIELPAPPSGK